MSSYFKTLIKLLVFVVSGFLVVICYQNCSPYYSANHQNALSLDSQSLNAKAQAILQQNCATCHGGAINSGGLSHIEDTNFLVQNGFIIPGDAQNSQIVSVTVDQSMPKSYSLSSSDIAVLQQWVVDLANQYPTGGTSGGGGSSGGVTPAPTCTVTVDKTSITSGQSVTLTLSVQGTAASALLNGTSVATTGGSLTISPTSTTTYSGIVSNSTGSNMCNSPTVQVTPVTPPPGGPSCVLSANPQNFVPGDPVKLTLSITGTATAATIQGTSVAVSNPTLTLSPIVSTTYSANVSNASGASSCSLQVSAKLASALTKDEYYRAKIGPNNKSIDDIMTANRCNNCHTANPPAAYSLAGQFYQWHVGQPSQNLATIKHVVSPNNPSLTWDLTLPTKGLYQFATGHKKGVATYGYSFTSAELTHLQNYVNHP